MSRTHVLIGVASIVCLAVMCGLFLHLADFWDPLKATRRRVPLGEDENAVQAAVGKPAESALGVCGPSGDITRRVLFWKYNGEDHLFVEFDEDGKSVQVLARRNAPTPWERLRAWWPW